MKFLLLSSTAFCADITSLQAPSYLSLGCSPCLVPTHLTAVIYNYFINLMRDSLIAEYLVERGLNIPADKIFDGTKEIWMVYLLKCHATCFKSIHADDALRIASNELLEVLDMINELERSANSSDVCDRYTLTRPELDALFGEYGAVINAAEKYGIEKADGTSLQALSYLSLDCKQCLVPTDLTAEIYNYFINLMRDSLIAEYLVERGLNIPAEEIFDETKDVWMDYLMRDHAACFKSIHADDAPGSASDELFKVLNMIKELEQSAKLSSVPLSTRQNVCDRYTHTRPELDALFGKYVAAINAAEKIELKSFDKLLDYLRKEELVDFDETDPAILKLKDLRARPSHLNNLKKIQPSRTIFDGFYRLVKNDAMDHFEFVTAFQLELSDCTDESLNLLELSRGIHDLNFEVKANDLAQQLLDTAIWVRSSDAVEEFRSLMDDLIEVKAQRSITKMKEADAILKQLQAAFDADIKPVLEEDDFMYGSD